MSTNADRTDNTQRPDSSDSKRIDKDNVAKAPKTPNSDMQAEDTGTADSGNDSADSSEPSR